MPLVKKKNAPTPHDYLVGGLGQLRLQCEVTRNVIDDFKRRDGATKLDIDLIDRLFGQLLTVEMTIARFGKYVQS